jgi:hypothetical protein
MVANLDTIIERSNRVDLEGVDLEAFRTQPLDPNVLRTLRYMCDVESHTICYLREILATSAHQDPYITAFLVSCATSALQLPYNERMAFHSLQGHHLVSPLQGVH